MISPVELFAYGIVAVVLLPVVAIAIALAYYLGLWRSVKQAGRSMGVRWWDAVGPFVLVAGVLLVAGLAGTIPGEGDPGYLQFIFASVFATLGAIGATLALGNYDEHRQLTGALDSAGTVDTGPTALSGEATVDGQALRAPLSQEPAMLHRFRITERRGLGHRSASVERHYEQSETPFTLDDGTGAVVVDPTDAAVRFDGDATSHDAVLSLPADDETEQAVVDRISDRTDVAPDDDQYYRESRIEPGSDVTVLGTVARDPEARHPVVGDGDRRLVVFEGDIDAARERVGSRVKWGIGLAVVGLPVGVVGTFLVAGVL